MTAGVVIVGASVGGLTVAERLRGGGFTGPLTLVDADPEPPYDRPPLSKQVLDGRWPPDQARLRDPASLAALGLDLRLGRTAVRLDTDARRLVLDDGERLAYRTLVLATGLHARTLPRQPALAGVHTLRTLRDARRLRADLEGTRRVVVVGAGVLGCEIAATARTLGHYVTLVEPEPHPMRRVLGDRLGAHVARLHTGRGVRLLTSTAVAGPVGAHGRVTGVRTAHGEVLPADVVVVAVGGRPATDWLAGSGLTLDDGVVCDTRSRAAEHVYAVGDVARFPDGRGTRLENRTNATEQGLFVAADILGARSAYRPLPYLWSDQFGVRIQVYGGVPAHAAVRIVQGAAAEGRFVAHAEADGRLVGIVGWNSAAGLRGARALLARTTTPPPAGRPPTRPWPTPASRQERSPS
ncbi:FAD-dependent oxidoreductase [Streptomyces sp. NPDC023723]|uniref:NAD(P)/FAD-dependent oxidoreductase n=1 Tax=Streptomyces sp. NPDC023723 TaxID=3154323 RepID=UPI0033E8420B